MSFFPAILTLLARGHVTQRLPWEILELICDHSEPMPDEEIVKEAQDRHFACNPVPRPEYEADLATIDMPSDCHHWPEVPLKKHHRNRFILSMTHICRHWRIQLIGLRRLWREIAFSADTTQIGIRLATLFLAKVADDDIPLHIYAGLPFGDLLDPTIGVLLSKLRDQTHRWEIFLYWGRLGPYRSYLDHPAPRLRHFSNHHDLCHLYFSQTTQLFAGYTPILQSLTTSALRDWKPGNLANLRVLDLWDCTPRLSIRSLLDVLCYTAQLEEINIISPNSPLLDCPLEEVVNLPHLKSLKVQNPDFYAIIEHFTVPNVRTVHLCSASNGGADALQVGPAFRAAHLFVGLTSMVNQLPMFDKPILFSSLDVEPTSSGLRFVIAVITENGAILRAGLEWIGGFGVRARSDYIRSSMSALGAMPFLSPSILYITVHPGRIDYNNPLFHLDAIECLVVEGETFKSITNALSGGLGRPSLLPKLRYFFFLEDELDLEMVDAIPEFLRFRKNLVMVLGTENRNLAQLLCRVCVIEGVSISLETA